MRRREHDPVRCGGHQAPREAAVRRPLPVRLTPSAQDDLVDLWAHIGEFLGVASADNVVAAVMGRFASIADWPDIGVARGNVRPNLRALFHPPYVIYYRSSETEVVVVRILHGKQDRDGIADAGGLSED